MKIELFSTGAFADQFDNKFQKVDECLSWTKVHLNFL